MANVAIEGCRLRKGPRNHVYRMAEDRKPVVSVVASNYVFQPTYSRCARIRG